MKPRTWLQKLPKTFVWKETSMNSSELDIVPQSEWLTVREAAAYLKVKPRTLLLWIRQQKVKAYVLSGIKRRVWRLRKENLDAVMLASAVLRSEPLTVLPEGRNS